MSPPRLVAIDGPAGAGKSTIARMLAAHLGVAYINTGAMYRALGLYAGEQGIPIEEAPLVAAMPATRMALRAVDATTHVFLGDRDVTDAVRSPEIGERASRLSVFPRVREAMVAIQQAYGRAHGGVMEGRDIGTVVFPDAPVKFFLTASTEERARRRLGELAALGKPADLDSVRAEVEDRDRRDIERPIAPLRIAPGAILIDTTGMDTGAVISRLVSYMDALKQG